MRLRLFRPDDAHAVHRWFNNSKATRTLLERRDSFTLDDAWHWTTRAVQDEVEDRKFAILVGAGDDPVGFTALYGLSRRTPPELGILIGDRTAPGVGRAAEALTLTMAFDELDAHRVYGRIAADNRAAKWVVESLGWHHEATMRGHLRRRGRTGADCEIWGVCPDDFRAAIADRPFLIK